MKKFWCFSLIACFTVLLTACAGQSAEDIKQPSKSSTDSTISAESQPFVQQEETETVITETILVEEKGVKITAKSLDVDGIFGPELQLLIENNSGKDLTIQCRDSSINGYMTETMMSVNVTDGKKANDTLTFLHSDLELCKIQTIADMAFSFHIFTSADWETYLDTPQIQLKTSAAETYEYVYDDSGELAYEENGIRIIFKELTENDSLLGQVSLFI